MTVPVGTIVHGDCLEVMATWPDESIDSVCCDPPYGLEFMGKEWDRIGGDAGQSRSGLGPRPTEWTAFGGDPFGGANPSCATCGGRKRGANTCACADPDWRVKGERVVPRHAAASREMQDWHYRWAVEAFRVAKPGAHLLAFGGTRTYHRLASAIEDAGWEIRDTLVWAYASGFPKSLDVSKAIDKRPGVSNHARFARHLAERREAQGLSRADVSEAVVGTRSGACWNWEHHQFPEAKWWPALRDLLALDGEWEAVIAEAERIKTGERDGNLLAVAPGQGADRSRLSLDITAPATDAAREWQGWGTALKPAWEPIVLARKPLRGTVAANVQAYGTGALNIDGCRIGYASEADRAATEAEMGGPRSRNRVGHNDIYGAREPTGNVSTHDGGRWPANVILTDPIFDGDTPGVVGGGDTGPAGVAVNRNRTGTMFDPSSFGWEGHGTEDVTYGDSGTYSRFFLVPKSSRSDREPVLGGLPLDGERVLNSGSSGRTMRDGVWVETHSEPRLRANSHPTVKPTDLMRHLVRLVTPPDGIVLDPFMGSGTTALACEMEGFRWVGIEREAEYVAIAEARLNGTQRGLGLVG